MTESGREDGALARVGSDALTAVLGQAAVLVIGVVGVVLATRLLGAEGYGRLAFFTSAAQLFFVIGIQWAMSAGVRFGREALARQTDLGRVLGSWLTVVAVSTGSSLLLLGLLAPLLASWSGSVRGAWLIGFFVLCVAAARTQEQVLLMASRLRELVWSRALAKASFCVVLAVLFVREGPGGAATEQIVFLMAAGFGLQACGLLRLLRPDHLRHLRVTGEDAARVALYSLPFLGRSAAGYLLDWIDVAFLRFWRTTAEIGVYQVAYQWMTVTTEALGAALLPVLPLLTAQRALGNESFAERYAGRSLPQISVAWTLSLCLLGCLGGPLLPLLLDPSFADAPRLFGLLLVAAAFQSTLYGTLPLLASHDLAKHGMRITAAMVVVNLALDLALVPSLGAFGAALATAATYAAGGLLHAHLLARSLGVRRLPLLIPACLGLPAFAALALPAPFLVSGSLCLASSAALVGWSRRTGLFSAADSEALVSIRMPATVRAGLRLAYRALGARS